MIAVLLSQCFDYSSLQFLHRSLTYLSVNFWIWTTYEQFEALNDKNLGAVRLKQYFNISYKFKMSFFKNLMYLCILCLLYYLSYPLFNWPNKAKEQVYSYNYCLWIFSSCFCLRKLAMTKQNLWSLTIFFLGSCFKKYIVSWKATTVFSELYKKKNQAYYLIFKNIKLLKNQDKFPLISINY